MDAFTDRLTRRVLSCRSPLLVGLDPRQERLPAGLAVEATGERQEQAASFRTFCCEIIDVVASLVPAVKPQAAFFEALGPAGMSALREVIRYARERDVLVIVDGKRNDIASTAKAYAQGWLGSDDRSAWGADALTINPYLGEESLTPFVEIAQERDAGLFVLVKTSNPGGGMFQDLVADGQPLFAHVAQWVETLAISSFGKGTYGSVGAVVGATYPAELAELRVLMPHSWFLVPGFGNQGATAADVAGAFDENGLGAVVVSARDIIFAHQRPDYASRFGGQRWQRAVEAATLDTIDALRSETTASHLA